MKLSENNMEIQDLGFTSPHVVILGAGASLAAFPNGDKKGKKLPLMNNLVEIVGLASLLAKAGISDISGNFEELYSAIHSDPNKQCLAREMENRIFDYFLSLELPDHPTLYDHLVLSLRSKDLIATFNWDPFLFFCLQRNCERADMPRNIYLHGNVAIGYCSSCRVFGPREGYCERCGKSFERSPLLFPIKQKGYDNNPFIHSAWQTFKRNLKQAYFLTIFGYSAPTSDVDAISIVKESWGPGFKREMEQVEFIDIKSEKDIIKTWKDILCRNHYDVTDNVYNTRLAKHPRRSCESLYQAVMRNHPYPARPIPKKACFPELWEWVKPLVEVEKSAGKQK